MMKLLELLMTARYLVIMSTTSCSSGTKYDPKGESKHFTIRLYLQFFNTIFISVKMLRENTELYLVPFSYQTKVVGV